MDSQVITALIGGGFLLASTIASGFAAYLTKRTSDSVKLDSRELSKRLDETSRVTFVEGERDSHDALTRLTLNEPTRVDVTRFSPKSVQRQSRYFSAIQAKLTGAQFEEENYGRLERYNRLTSLCSQENKDSLLSMLRQYLKLGVRNFTLRVTIDKNDFELLIFEKTKIAALCFHDLSKQDVVHSCIIVSDRDMYVNFYRLYQKLWNEDILIEIDFSLGEAHVEEQIERLAGVDPVVKSDGLSVVDGIVSEAEAKIAAARLAKNFSSGPQ